MSKLNRGFIRDALSDFLKTANKSDAYLEGAGDFANFLQEKFPEEKNIHLSKDGVMQNLYRFHFNVGVLPTSKEKWMSPKEAEAFARRNGFRLELVRTTHKAAK